LEREKWRRVKRRRRKSTTARRRTRKRREEENEELRMFSLFLFLFLSFSLFFLDFGRTTKVRKVVVSHFQVNVCAYIQNSMQIAYLCNF